MVSRALPEQEPTMSRTAYPYARPLYLMAKPAGATCNLSCSYCYYLEKQKLYTGTGSRLMSDEVLETYIRDYIQLQAAPEVCFTWHGGEPLLRPLSFYQHASKLQAYYAEGKSILNCLQTNGLLLTPEWCRFLHDEGWLVGISIDGTRTMHDTYRLTRGGEPTWERVRRAIDLLDRYEVEWNAMATVHQGNVEQPLEFYHFFRDELSARYLQFTPVVERIRPHKDGRSLAHLLDEDCPMAPYSVQPDQWGRFLCSVFDEWSSHDVGQYFVQMFEAVLAGWKGFPPGVCSFAEDCGHAAVLEWNGDVYCCDHFVFPEYRLGNILTDNLLTLLYGTKQEAFSRLKTDALPLQCKQCEFLHVCHGECPRLRFARTPEGEPGLNYLCSGYRTFFQHAAPFMEQYEV